MTDIIEQIDHALSVYTKDDTIDNILLSAKLEIERLRKADEFSNGVISATLGKAAEIIVENMKLRKLTEWQGVNTTPVQEKEGGKITPILFGWTGSDDVCIGYVDWLGQAFDLTIRGVGDGFGRDPDLWMALPKAHQPEDDLL